MRANNVLNTVKIVGVAVALSFGVALVYGFGPTSAPPYGNAAAPLNVSATAQTKSGSLTLGGNLSTNVVYSNYVYNQVTGKWLGYDSLVSSSVASTSGGVASLSASCLAGTVISSCAGVGLKSIANQGNPNNGNYGTTYSPGGPEPVLSTINTSSNSCTSSVAANGGTTSVYSVTSVTATCLGIQ